MSPVTETPGTFGAAITPAQWATYLLEHLSAAHVVMASGATPVDTVNRVVHIPRIPGDGAVGWYAELAPIGPGDPVGDELMLTPRKKARPGDLVTAETQAVTAEDALFPEETDAHRERNTQTARRIRHGPAMRAPRPRRTRDPVGTDPPWRHSRAALAGRHRHHCTDYYAAAVGRVTHYRSIGIDAEPDEPLLDGILDHIYFPTERAQLARRHRPYFDRLLFSAKETVYKTWFPIAQRWLGFDQAFITYATGHSMSKCSFRGRSPRSAVGGWRETD